MARKPKTPRSRDPSSEARRAAALRENLRRRKRQQRLRRVAAETAESKDAG